MTGIFLPKLLDTVMENFTPKEEPRRKAFFLGPTIGTAHVDPCIVYLEMAGSTPSQIPALFLCWAQSSSEIREVGGKTRLKLNHVHVIISTRMQEERSVEDEIPSWQFIVFQHGEVMVESDIAQPYGELSFHLLFGGKNIGCGRGEIQFIDQETNLSLELLAFDKTRKDNALAKRILEIGTVDWRSLNSAKTFLQNSTPAIIVSEIRVPREQTEGDLIFDCGEAYYKSGQYKLAAEALQLALKHVEVRYQALNLMGLSFMKRGMSDFAIKTLTSAASELPAMDDSKKEIIYSLGLAYEEDKNPGKALQQWKRIYECDMSFRDVARRVEGSYGID